MTPIAVLDVATGERSVRAHDTLTLDVPRDFPRTGGVFTVSDGFRANYMAIAGKQVIRNVTPRPLSWRAEGEMCLVARTGSGLRRQCHYRLCSIEAAESRAP
ncbi:MAG: hypothetical protein ACXWLR_14375 [Myxococcales bacterium]